MNQPSPHSCDGEEILRHTHPSPGGILPLSTHCYTWASKSEHLKPQRPLERVLHLDRVVCLSRARHCVLRGALPPPLPTSTPTPRNTSLLSQAHIASLEKKASSLVYTSPYEKKKVPFRFLPQSLIVVWSAAKAKMQVRHPQPCTMSTYYSSAVTKARDPFGSPETSAMSIHTTAATSGTSLPLLNFNATPVLHTCKKADCKVFLNPTSHLGSTAPTRKALPSKDL